MSWEARLVEIIQQKYRYYDPRQRWALRSLIHADRKRKP